MKRALLVIAALLVNTAMFAGTSVQPGTDDIETGTYWPFPDDLDC